MLSLKTRGSLATAAAAFALAAASVSVATPAFAADQGSAQVMCFGVNACKGQSDCKSGNHDCKGQNSCKGQGFKHLSAATCSAEHGSTTPPGE